VLPTSGTTGTPKLVSHSLESLTRTTRVDIQRAADCRWGLLYDYARFAGLQVVLQALLPGATLIAPSPAASLAKQVTALARGGCTHLSATPTLWRKILMTEGNEQLKLRQITLGGEIVEERVLRALRHRFPQARITHIYASTEAGVGFSVSDGHEGFPANYLAESPAGIELRVRNGKLFVRNSSVQPRYVGTVDQFADDQGFVDTGDLVTLRGDRYVFLGRETGVINVGGNKVHPEEVEQVLMSHPEVWQARVSSKKNPITGSLVVAEIVTGNDVQDPTALRISITDLCHARLARHKVPALIRIVKELPCSATGKLAREDG
jgi:acyl-coenzyme A synthetase/AMP-(fatty) acid ligase